MKSLAKFPLWCFVMVACLPSILYPHELMVMAGTRTPTAQKADIGPGRYGLAGLCPHSPDEYSILLSENIPSLRQPDNMTTFDFIPGAWNRLLRERLPNLFYLARKIAGERDFTFVNVSYNSMTDGADQKETKDFSNIMGANYAILFGNGAHSLFNECGVSVSGYGLSLNDSGRITKVVSHDDPLRYMREYLETKK